MRLVVEDPAAQVPGVAVHAEHRAWAEEAVPEGVEVADAANRTSMKRTSMIRNPTLYTGCFLCLLTTSLALAQVQSPTAKVSHSAGETPNPPESFATPRKAADALIASASSYDMPALLRLFGNDGRDLVSSSDPVRDKQYVETFNARVREKNEIKIDPKNPARAVLIVGNDDWPMPVPLVRAEGKWHFDAKQGHDEILYRRIGANELDAIQVCRGFVEAQKEYASEIHDNSGVNQYAQKIISTPGRHDGLYWQKPDGSSGGPVGEAVARAIDEGYSANAKSGYHGYYFKVLKGQGPAARLGQLDYVIDGAMIGGFALVAVPAQYRVTGVKSFLVSYDGVVYEKDLGPDSLEIVSRMDRYNPDQSWKPTTASW